MSWWDETDYSACCFSSIWHVCILPWYFYFYKVRSLTSYTFPFIILLSVYIFYSLRYRTWFFASSILVILPWFQITHIHNICPFGWLPYLGNCYCFHIQTYDPIIYSMLRFWWCYSCGMSFWYISCADWIFGVRFPHMVILCMLYRNLKFIYGSIAGQNFGCIAISFHITDLHHVCVCDIGQNIYFYASCAPEDGVVIFLFYQLFYLH